MTEYKIDLTEAVTENEIHVYNDMESHIVTPISWKWINSFAIKCKFKFKNKIFEVIGKADARYSE